MKFLHRAGVVFLAVALVLGMFPAAALAADPGAPGFFSQGLGTTLGVTIYTISWTENGTVDYVILPQGAATPSAAQVKAHTDASDSAAPYSGSVTPTGSGSQWEAVLLSTNSAPYTNLAPGKYSLFVICTDSEGNKSDVRMWSFHGYGDYSLEVKETLTVTVESESVRIVGATVKVGADTKTTDSNGQAIFTLSAGTYSYLVQKSGFTGVSGSYTADKQTDTKTVSLTSGSGGDYSAILNVSDDKGTKLKNAKVTIGSDTKTAGADGSVEFYLTPGTYAYTASALGRITKTGSITVTDTNTGGNVEMATDPDGADLVINAHQRGELGDEIAAILDANSLSTGGVGSLTVHGGVMDSSDFSYSSGGMETLWSGTNVFTSVDLSDTTLYNNLLPESAFRGASHLSSITLPNTVTEIGAYAFGYCSVSAFTFPNSVEVIGDSVFEYCTSLKSVTFSSRVKSFGDYLFSFAYGSGMAPVQDVYMSITDPASVTVSGNAFFNNSDAVLHVDESLIGSYTSDSRDGSTTDAKWYGLWIDDPDAAPVIRGVSAGWVSAEGAYFYFRSDSPGKYYYAMVDDGDPAPTINTAGTGTALTSLQGQTVFEGPTTAKDVYIVLKGRNGNLSNVLKMDIPVAGTASIDVTVTGHAAGSIWDEINVKLKEANLSYNYNKVGSLTVNGGTINGGDAEYISYLPLTKADFARTSFEGGKIPDGLLASCDSITTLVLPDSVTALGQYTFYGLTSLKSVTLGSAVPPTLSDAAFVSRWDDDDNPIYDHAGAVVYVPVGSVSAYQTAADNDAADGKWYGFAVEEMEPVPVFVAITSITGVPATATAGTDLTLSGTVAPTDATNKTIVWSVKSAGTTGAMVSGNKLSTTAAGTATVTATITNGLTASSDYTQDFTITVNAAPPVFVAVTGITGVSTTATAGTGLTLSGTVAPTNATNKTISWSVKSAGTTGATISGNILSTTAGGTVIVTATITNGLTTSADYTQDFTVAISTALPAVIPVAVSCTKTDVTLYGSANGSLTVTASGGNSGSFEYSIDGGASWQSTGAFGGVAAGTYTVAVRDAANMANGATCTVTVGQPKFIGKVAANQIATKANVGTAVTVVPPAPPKGYTTTSVTYSSSKPAVASVDANGNVTFLSGGRVTIATKIVSATVDKKGKVRTKITTVRRTITVQQKVASITLNRSSATVARKGNVKLSASIAPATASNKTVLWKSSNPKVATVSSKGVVTGKAAGTAIITCAAKDGSGISASCTVTVVPIYPNGIKLSKTALTIKVGKVTSLKATVLPQTTDFRAVTWASSNPAVATVDAKGRVKGVAPGTAVITAATSNGKSASCTVTVR